MLLSTCWLGATQTHTARQLARGGGDQRRIAANIRLGRVACRCGAAKACGCRHGRKSLTAGAVETLLEHTLVPAASMRRRDRPITRRPASRKPAPARLAELRQRCPHVDNDIPICLGIQIYVSAALRTYEPLTFGNRSKCEVKGFIAPEAMKRLLEDATRVHTHEVVRPLLHKKIRSKSQALTSLFHPKSGHSGRKVTQPSRSR